MYEYDSRYINAAVGWRGVVCPRPWDAMQADSPPEISRGRLSHSMYKSATCTDSQTAHKLTLRSQLIHSDWKKGG